VSPITISKGEIDPNQIHITWAFAATILLPLVSSLIMGLIFVVRMSYDVGVKMTTIDSSISALSASILNMNSDIAAKIDRDQRDIDQATSRNAEQDRRITTLETTASAILATLDAIKEKVSRP
jgi:hypothetical protein